MYNLRKPTLRDPVSIQIREIGFFWFYSVRYVNYPLFNKLGFARTGAKAASKITDHINKVTEKTDE